MLGTSVALIKSRVGIAVPKHMIIIPTADDSTEFIICFDNSVQPTVNSLAAVKMLLTRRFQPLVALCSRFRPQSSKGKK